MANHETNWIVKLIDKVTAPAKAADDITKKLSDTVRKVTANLDLMGEEARASATEAIKAQRELSEEFKKQERRVDSLREHLETLNDPLSRAQVEFDIQSALTQMRRYEEQLHNIQEELEQVEIGPDPDQMASNWGEAVVVANQAMELIQKSIDSLDFTREIDNLKGNIQLMSEASGAELDELTAKAYKLGKVFSENPEEIARAANAMVKQLGGTYQENFDLIQKGFEKGANLNGDFLDQLKEYGPQLKEAGLSAEQSIALMAKAGKDGIYSDKAIDAIKEANLSLREMGQPQIDALRAIGIEAKDLAGKTSFEAMQMISKSMDGATTQARQLVLTDIFKGAGEDAGKGFIEGFSNIDLDISKLPSVEQSGAGITGWLADLQTSFSSTFGSIGSSIVYLAPVITAIGSMIPIISALSKVTWIQQAAQWALNIAMDANPIGLIILGITALVGLVVAAIKYYDDWGAALLIFTGPLGFIINLFQSFRRHWDSIVEAFKTDGIVGGLKRIGLVILDALLMPIQQLLELVAKLPGMEGIAGTGVEFIKKIRANLELDTPEPEKEKDEKTADKHKFKTLGGDANKLDGKSNLTKDTSSSSAGSSSRIINMTLNVDNNFNVKDGGDFMSRKEEILDYVVGRMNDSMKDGLIAAGT